MEKTKQEIEKYIKTNFDSYAAKKKSLKKNIHSLRLYSNDVTKFIVDLDKNIKQIIKKNGINDINEINKLISNAKEIIDKRFKEIVIGGQA